MNNAEVFFKNVTSEMKKEKVKLILVTHLLPDRPLFLKALSEIVDIVAIIPKPNSIDNGCFSILRKEYYIKKISKVRLNDSKFIITFIRKIVGKNRFIISDMGGYFSFTLEEIFKEFKDKLLGIVEDTENGHIKYEKLSILPCPIFSIARSSLKYPEDILVGYSTVYSAESILRKRNEVLTGKNATVIGYGRIGQHIVRDLKSKKVRVNVYDNNMVKMIHALAEGNKIVTKEQALSKSDLIFCVTGNKSLNNSDLEKINNECYIFSITSSDDEFYLSDNFPGFKKKQFYPIGLTLHRKDSKIHLVNNGNAVNFIDNAVVGNFIYLVQAEIIHAIKIIAENQQSKGIKVTENSVKEKIAHTWIKFFSNEDFSRN
jgi:adenosylhomocysteinase